MHLKLNPMTLKSINPYNNQLIKSYKEHSQKQAIKIIKDVDKAHIGWKNLSINKRASFFKKVGAVLLNRKKELATLMTLEMGKPITGGIAEIEKCIALCEYYAKQAAEFLKDEEVKTEAGKSFITYEPLGVILAIMPWNFPFWQAFRFIVPHLIAGNCGILKHSSNVSGCALAIESILVEAGIPENVFKTILVSGKKINFLLEHPIIKAVTLTGSTAAGKTVAAKAGSLIKKTVLELGGSDAYIILDDADIELAAETCTNSRLINSGQSCIAAKRFIVVKTIETEFTGLFIEKMKAKIMGDPMDENTHIGPQARIDLRDDLHKQVKKSIKKGAKLILGGKIESKNDAFYPATILTNVKKGMPAYDEELFGPVASIIIAKNQEEAIEIANDTVFGLGASVFTNDLKKGELIAKTKLAAGSCFVNELVKSDPRLPFGGINQSGYGRELGHHGILEFVNIKTVFIK